MNICAACRDACLLQGGNTQVGAHTHADYNTEDDSLLTAVSLLQTGRSCSITESKKVVEVFQVPW